MAGIEQMDTVTNSTEPSSARRQIEALLARQGMPLTAQNVSRVLAANQADPSVLPNIVGAPEPMSTPRGDRGGSGSQRNSGRGAPSRSVATDIEGNQDLPVPPIPPVGGAPTGSEPNTPSSQRMRDTPQVGGDSAASAPPPRADSPMPRAGGGDATAVGGDGSSGPTTEEQIGALLFGTGMTGAAGLAGHIMRQRAMARMGIPMGNAPMPPTGTIYDVPDDIGRTTSAQPALAGPRAALPPPSAPGSAPTGSAAGAPAPMDDPMQAALSRAVDMPPGAPPGVGGPRSAGALPPPGVRPPIVLSDQTSGPPVSLPDQSPIPPTSGVAPGPTTPTTVGRTASPAAEPRNIARPMVDPSRMRTILDLIARNAPDVSRALRSVR